MPLRIRVPSLGSGTSPTSNVIKSATTVSTGTLKKNNFLIGVSSSVDYGPTSITEFWNGISPTAGGYTIYSQKVTGGPSIRTASNDSDLITIAKQYGGTNINTINDALNYFNGTTDNLVTNITYENIVTDGLTAIWDGGFVPSYPRTGTTWSDLSGNNYDLELVGSPVYSGANGGGVYFDGINDTARSSSVTLNYSQGFSLSIWFEISSLADSAGLFAFNGTNYINFGYSPSGGWFGWETGGPVANRLYWFVAPVANQVYNFTCTYNPETNESIIYNNNTQVASDTISTFTNTFDTAQLKLDYEGEFPLFNGVIYNCYFYTDKVLSPTEVSQNFNALRGRYGL